ncbi:outer membrane beta-barrel protein [Myxococcota bacterium]|nr:outer membrane beta-barrel protein [Myxococcota bacterium]
MRKSLILLASLLLLSFPVGAAPQNTPTKSSQAKVTAEPNYFAVEFYGASSGCIGDWCEGTSPLAGGGGGFFNRSGNHWGWGLQFLFLQMANDDFDSVHYYNISMEGRGYLPLGPVDFYVGGGLGYLTYYMDNNKGTTYDWIGFRATAPSLSLEVGVDVAITANLKLGLFGRFIMPLWSEACLAYADVRDCIEPQDDSVKLDLKFWVAGLKISWILPY